MGIKKEKWMTKMRISNNMKTWKIALVAAAALSALAVGATSAQAGDMSGYVSVTSAYMSRGTEQNVNHDPAIRGGVNWSNEDGYYVNAFASTMDFGEGSTQELDFFAGKKWTVGKATVDLGVASINYPNNHLPWNFVEYDLKVDHPVGKGNVGAWIGYTDSYFNIFGQGLWTEVHGSYPLTDKLSVSGALANQALKNDFDYRTYNIGATYAVTPNVAVDLRYSDTDAHNLDPIWGTYDGRFSATATLSF